MIDIYLAAPYSHADESVRVKRFEEVTRAAGEILKKGHTVFSPLTHSHPMVKYGFDGDWQTWKKLDLAFIDVCRVMVVLMLDGWEDSAGIRAEMEYANLNGKRIIFISNGGDYGVSRIFESQGNQISGRGV